MRNHYLILVFVLLLSACKNDTEKTTPEILQTEEAQELVTMRGDFIYYEGAAVLQTPHTIYGVVLDDMAERLRQEVANYQTNKTEMIPVTLKAKRIPRPEGADTWPFSIEIKEILKIEQPERDARDLIELSK
jgi:hypothetical protein